MNSINQFGLAHVWSQGGVVIQLVALLLLAMSVASWVVIVLKALDALRYKKNASHLEEFWGSSSVEVGLEKLGGDPQNPFYKLALQGLQASQHHTNTRALQDSLCISDWVTRSLENSVDEFTAKLQSGMAVLASVGSTAPFVGLFGTVWGIYHALLSIGANGQASIDQVAGPVGEALIMTALGLAVAIPAVLGHNALVRTNKSVLHKQRRFAHDLHAYFVTGSRVSK